MNKNTNITLTGELFVGRNMENRITEVLQHDISWWIDEGEDKEVTELDESTIEHIEECIKEGYSSGQIVTENGTGWWSMIDWQDIACELYNCVTNRTDAGKKARKRFNDKMEGFRNQNKKEEMEEIE